MFDLNPNLQQVSIPEKILEHLLTPDNLRTPDDNVNLERLFHSTPDEKVKCECGKSVLPKNLPAHLKTQAHSNVIMVPNPHCLDNPTEPIYIPVSKGKNETGPKLTTEFKNLNTKLDLILEILADLHAAEYETDEEDESIPE